MLSSKSLKIIKLVYETPIRVFSKNGRTRANPWQTTIATMRPIQYVGPEERGDNRSPTYIFHCNVCNQDIKTQRPIRGSSGSSFMGKAYITSVRFIEQLGRRYTELGGGPVRLPWDINQSVDLLCRTLREIHPDL